MDWHTSFEVSLRYPDSEFENRRFHSENPGQTSARRCASEQKEAEDGRADERADRDGVPGRRRRRWLARKGEGDPAAGSGDRRGSRRSRPGRKEGAGPDEKAQR